MEVAHTSFYSESGKPHDFHPISQSTFLLNALEILIDFQRGKTISTQLISGTQHASGADLLRALFFIKKGLRYREYALAAFWDIERIFNNIEKEAIKECKSMECNE